ncbi:MAG: hypothetical protein K9L79_00315 [Methylobacter tundripaludum]|nr:hypothetical protein [Methylobacter tundripaludum]
MPNYKDIENKIHFLDSDEYESLLPAGCIKITDDEALAILNPQPTIEQTKADMVLEMQAHADAAIISGVTDEALGSVHHYPTTRDDQLNLNGLITASLLPGSGDEFKFWCANADGLWARRVHTKAQIQTVGKTVANHVKTIQERYEQRLDAISKADSGTIGSVIW